MADFFKDSSGALYVRTPGGEAMPIEAGDIEDIEANGLSRTLTAAGRGVGTIATGVGSLMGVEGMDEQFAEHERKAEVQGAMSPVTAMGEFLPDLALGIATGGGSIPAQIAKGAAVEGVLGAARNPENPVQGALVQGGLGAAGVGAGAVFAPVLKRSAVMGRTLSTRFTGTAQEVVNNSRKATAVENGLAARGARSVGAAETSTENLAVRGGGDRQLAGFRTSDEVNELAEELSVIQEGETILTRGDDAALRADSLEAMERADGMRGKEERFRSQVLTDQLAGGLNKNSVSGLRDKQRELTMRTIKRELGVGTDKRFTNDTLIEEKTANRAEFDEVAAQAGPLKFTEADTAKLQDAVIEGGAQDSAALTRRADNIQKDINDSNRAVGEAGTLSPKAAQGHRTALGKEHTRAAKAGNTVKAEAIQDMIDVLDEVVERQIPEEVAETLYNARYKFRIMLALERANATNKGGEINTSNFLNNITKGSNTFGESFKRGTRSERLANQMRELAGEEALETKGGEFMRNLETLAYLQEKVEPDSGTAGRLMEALGSNNALLGAGAAAVYGATGE